MSLPPAFSSERLANTDIVDCLIPTAAELDEFQSINQKMLASTNQTVADI
jgi:hypothetical protein